MRYLNHRHQADVAVKIFRAGQCFFRLDLILLMATLFSLISSVEAADTTPLNFIAAPLPGTTVCTDPAAPAKRCLVADLRGPAGKTLRLTTPRLEPGLYSLVIRMKLSALGTRATGPLQWRISVGEESPTVLGFDVLRFETAKAYQDFLCKFSVVDSRPTLIVLDWQRGQGQAGGPDDSRFQAATVKELPKMSDVNTATVGRKPAANAPDDLLDAEPPLDSLQYLNLAIGSVNLKRIGDVDIENLEVDKIRYKPGEAITVNAAIHNFTARAGSFELVTELLHGLDEVTLIERRTISVPPRSRLPVSIAGPKLEKFWGYAVRMRLVEAGADRAAAQEYFTVHSNMWAAMILGKMPGQFTRDVTLESARATAIDNKKHYGNMVENFVWAPDDFGNYTPETEYWTGGQACYPGSRTGTHYMIDEGHKVGVTYALYANLWGGGGPPSYEAIRRHPDWGKPSYFNTEWMERWGRDPGMHVWIMCNNNYSNPAPFHHHASEIIKTHQIYGWDAIRYDSYSQINVDDPMLRLVKADVAKQTPEVQWGYNTEAPTNSVVYPAAFAELCRNGGLIMDEGARSYGQSKGTYPALAQRILDWSTVTRKFGGHYTAIGQDKAYLNDILYQNIFWFAGNAHPWFGDWKDGVANYRQFATRYAELIFDPAVAPAPNAQVDVGAADKFLLMFPRYLRHRDGGGGRRQLIMQFINAPVSTNLYTENDNLLPPPRDPFQVTVKLPGAAKVRGLWHLTPEYELTQEPIQYELHGSELSFKAPRLRFWNLAVLDLEGAGAEFDAWKSK